MFDPSLLQPSQGGQVQQPQDQGTQGGFNPSNLQPVKQPIGQQMMSNIAPKDINDIAGYANPASAIPTLTSKLMGGKSLGDMAMGALGDVFNNIVGVKQAYAPENEAAAMAAKPQVGELTSAAQSAGSVLMATQFPGATGLMAMANQVPGGGLAANVAMTAANPGLGLWNAIKGQIPFLKVNPEDSDTVGAFKSLLGTALDFGAMHGATKFNEGLGQATDWMGSKLSGAPIKIPDWQARQQQEFNAGNREAPPNTVRDTVYNRGLFGTPSQMGDQAAKMSTDIWQKEIQPWIDKVPGKIPFSDFLPDILKGMNEAVKDGRADRGDIIDAYNQLAGDRLYESKDLGEWNSIKSNLKKQLPGKVQTKGIGSAWNIVNDLFASSLQGRFYKEMDNLGAGEGVKKSMSDWGNLQNIKDAGVSAKSGASVPSDVFGLTRAMGAHVGTPLLTGLGQLLNHASDYFRSTNDVINARLPVDLHNTPVNLGDIFQSLGGKKVKDIISSKVDTGEYAKEFDTQVSNLKNKIGEVAQGGKINIGDVHNIIQDLFNE